MTDTLDKAGKLGSVINNWFKIALSIVMLIGYGFLTYYQIKSNSENIAKITLLIEEKNKTTSRELEITSSRSNKRYKRAMNKADNLHKVDLLQSTQISELQKELWYMKGLMDAQK